MQQLASPQQAAPSTFQSQPVEQPVPDLGMQSAESIPMHDAEEVPATLPQPESDPGQSPGDAKPVVEIADTEPTLVYPDNQLGLSDYDSPCDLDASPAPVIRQAEAVAAATPMKRADGEMPVALVEDLQRLHISTPKPKPAPKKSCSMADDGIKFTGLTPDAVKVWTALLRRQSTDSISESPAPSVAAPSVEAPAAPNVEAPAAPNVAAPAAPSVAAPSVAAPSVAAQAAPSVAAPAPATPMSMAAEPKLVELSPLQLMKMDEVQLGHQLVQVQKCPEFAEFEKGVQVAPGDPLKTLLLFDAWKQQHAKMAPEQQQEQQPQPASSAVAPTPPAAPPGDSDRDGGDDDQRGDDDEKKAGRAMYMRYYRSVRSSRVPAAVAVKFRQACHDPTGKLAAELFAAYIECNENWLSSSIVLEESQTHNETEGGRWGWLTKEDP